ncbi:hypothetical protein ACUNIU_21450 [Serratia sp. IR-2025]
MDNKLSELKAAAFSLKNMSDRKAKGLRTSTLQINAAAAKMRGMLTADAALALLAELAEKDKRIAELEQLPTIKHMRSVEESLIRATDMVSDLEAKLATPVRLPDVLFIKVSGSAVPVMHAERVKERIQRAGFKVKGGE